MGQGQTKASKKREANGEPSPSPKKEAKKSPKRTSKSSRSSGTPSIETPSSSGKEPIEVEERESSPQLRRGRESREREEPSKQESKYDSQVDEVDGRETLVNDVMKEVPDKQISESPPKPKRTYEVGFIEQEKENVPVNVSEIKSSPKTPVKMNGEPEPLTPVHMNELNHISPQATSTPHPNGMLSTGQRGSGGHYSDEDQDHTDVSDDEAFSSEQQLRTSSPSASNVSLKSFSTVNSSERTRSDSTFERKTEVNYGRFYNTSYLKPGSQNYLNARAKSDSEARNTQTHQFIRPANFSYAKEPPSFLKGKKGGMMQLTQGTKVVTKTRRSSSPAGVKTNNEAIRLSMFPGGKPPAPKEIAKIEREDWPGPPSPAALLPEIMRQRRKSRGEADEDEEEIIEDPKIKREIEELSKFKDESGIGKVIYKELEEAKALPMKLLDPWKASRVPNADHEPKFQTRFQSPMFASPSRFVDRPRRAWDDSDIIGYRTMSTLANFPVPKPGYGLQPKAATLPVSGAFGGPLNYRYYDMLMADRHDATTRTSNSSINTETSKVTSTVFDQPGVSLMTFQKSSWHTDVSPSIYPYDRLKISNFDLPKDVDRNMLEIHLSKDEFESIFDMAREEFRHLPEWKQNDLKKRMDLY